MMPPQEFRVGRPAPLQRETTFQAPVPTERKLKNGARALLVANHAVPIVAVEVRLLHGVDTDTAKKAGRAELAAEAAIEGTKKRTSAQLAQDLDALAARMFANTGQESALVHLNCLRETIEQCLAILADVVVNPAFRVEDVERVRTLRMARLQQKQANIGTLAFDETQRILYGANHPWGLPSGGTLDSVKSIKREELVKHHASYWVPNDAVISVSGDLEPDEAVAMLEKAFKSWKPKKLPKLALPAAQPALGRYVSAIDKPTATQSQVWVVGPMFAASDPDAVPLQIANLVLGGVFTSRLNLNLREKHGYSYGVFSGLQLGRRAGAFLANGGIVAKSTAAAVTEYEKELTAFASGDLTDEELARARDTYVRTIPSQLETNDAVASAMAGLVVTGLPLDHYRTLPARAKALTREQVIEVVKKRLQPEQFPIVIVGPVGAAKEELGKLGFGEVKSR